MAEPAIGGLRPDFMIIAPDGTKIVVEAKAWQKHPGYLKRAINQAKMYKEAIGADHALVVVEDLERSRISEGVVTVDRLVDALNLLLEGESPVAAEQYLAGQDQPKKTIFAAMPFEENYDDVYFVAMTYAAESIGATCKRVDVEFFAGDIVERIKSLITDSIAVIADLSESKANVLYEVGFAHGIGKNTVHICSTPLQDLPFDVRNWNTLKYEQGRVFHFRELLADSLREAIGNDS